MTGFRIGYLVANEALIRAYNKLQSHLTGNVAPFVQYGAISALDNEKSFKHYMTTTFQHRRDLAYQLLKDIMPSEKPQGAFYLFPKIDHLYSQNIKDDISLATHILEKSHVAILPGSFFGYPHHLRICYSTSDDEIKLGIEKMKAAL